MNSSLDVIPQHLYWVRVWALTGPVQKADILCLKLFCSTFTSVFRVVLLHQAVSAELELVDRHPLTTHYPVRYLGKLRNLFLPCDDGKLSRSRGSKAAQNHEAPSTSPLGMFLCWNAVSFFAIRFAVCSFQTIQHQFCQSIKHFPSSVVE